MTTNVYWLTGLSGAGKTSVGKKLYDKLKEENTAVAFLDGDTLREVLGGDLGYAIEDRRLCAMRYSRLCKLLAEQEISVVCCTISMFDSVREWNRENIPGYVEVYIKASAETLLHRDQKGLYSGLESGASVQVMGMDLAMEEPKSPDVVIENNGELSIEECANMIMGREKAI